MKGHKLKGAKAVEFGSKKGTILPEAEFHGGGGAYAAGNAGGNRVGADPHECRLV